MRGCPIPEVDGSIKPTLLLQLIHCVYRDLPPAPFNLLMDECSLVPRVANVSRKKGEGPPIFAGLCKHAPSVVKCRGLEDVGRLLDKLASGEWPVATHCKILGVARHGRTNYNDVRVGLQMTCNRFTAEDETHRLATFQKDW